MQGGASTKWQTSQCLGLPGASTQGPRRPSGVNGWVGGRPAEKPPAPPISGLSKEGRREQTFTSPPCHPPKHEFGGWDWLREEKWGCFQSLPPPPTTTIPLLVNANWCACQSYQASNMGQWASNALFSKPGVSKDGACSKTLHLTCRQATECI